MENFIYSTAGSLFMDKGVDAVPVVAGIAIGVALIVVFAVFFGTAPPNPQSLDGVIISMERTVCFGTCPDYELTIYGNGTVVYEGRNFVAVTGMRTSTIPVQDVRGLVTEFYRINYFSLEDEYTAQVTDLPTTTTSIKIDGRFKQVVDYYGAPEALRQLEERIDKVANSAVWVTG